MTRHRTAVHIVVGYVICLHLSWAYFLFKNQAAAGATGLAAVFNISSDRSVTIDVLVIVSLLSVLAYFVTMPWRVLLLMPQQSLLLISAVGAVSAILAGHFADGVIRPVEFIASDKIDTAYLAVLHAVAIVYAGMDDG